MPKTRWKCFLSHTNCLIFVSLFASAHEMLNFTWIREHFLFEWKLSASLLLNFQQRAAAVCLALCVCARAPFVEISAESVWNAKCVISLLKKRKSVAYQIDSEFQHFFGRVQLQHHCAALAKTRLCIFKETRMQDLEDVVYYSRLQNFIKKSVASISSLWQCY